jgi:CHAD domain-containing protein
MPVDVERIEKSTSRIAKFLRKNSNRPTAEAIHDLRTDSRRLETAFVTVELNTKGKVKRLLRDLGNVRKRAGKVRDMDVLTAYALTVQPKREQDCLVRLFEHLGAERSKYVKKLRPLSMAQIPNWAGVSNGVPGASKSCSSKLRKIPKTLTQYP